MTNNKKAFHSIFNNINNITINIINDIWVFCIWYKVANNGNIGIKLLYSWKNN